VRVEGEKTYVNEELIVWFNQAINCCTLVREAETVFVDVYSISGMGRMRHRLSMGLT